MGRFLVGCAALGTAVLLGSGCVVDVQLGFDPCTDESGKEYAEGESFSSEAPGGACQECTCQGGTAVCEAAPCPPNPFCTGDDGTAYEVGATFPASDGCNTCTCVAEGVVMCSLEPCPCAPEVPACPQSGIGCIVGPICTEIGWVCEVACEECSMQTFPECGQAPPGCWWEGPICDGGMWSCGALVCDGCVGEPPLCQDPGMPGCFAAPYCDPMLGWTCQVYCDPGTCIEPPPECPPSTPDCFSQPVCSDMGWWCETTCTGCAEPPPVCDTMDPYCIGTPVCDGVSWTCSVVCS